MDVYDVNEDLVKALVKLKKIEIISEKFIGIPTNHGRVNYIEELLVKYQQFSKLDLKINPHLNKNDEKSTNFRKDGNEYFSLKNKDYHKAFELYNKSICFSTKNSENLSIGYANRSAILFEWKRYRECLENIKLAKESNYPDRLRYKIEKREKDCLEFLKKEQHEQNKDSKPYNFQLSYNQHPVVPFIANCLDMKTSDECGRYIYTKKDLIPGDLIAIEKPYCSILLPSFKYTRCANCKKENFYTLIPCENCTSAMFCNEKCLKDGYDNFHKYECPIIDLLFELFTKIHLIGLRVTLTTINIFSNIDECMEFCRNDKNLNQNSFTLNYKNFTIKEHYRAIHGLVTNQSKRNIGDLFQRSVIIAILKRYILKYSKINEKLNNTDKENFFIDLLYQHLQVSSSNFHSIDLIDSEKIKNEQSYACGAYAFGSLLNHSCAPNIVRIHNGMNALIFILRPIKKNDILYDTYGYHYATHTKQIRQKNLQTQYKFTCNCEACKNDYKMFNELPQPKDCPEGITQNDIDKLLQYNWSFAFQNYKTYCYYLKNYDKYFPCNQISSVEESLKMALNILVDAIPLKLKY